MVRRTSATPASTRPARSSSSVRPQLWGIEPGRWREFDGHEHWVAKTAATGAFVLKNPDVTP
jgi:hypothetical protein